MSPVLRHECTRIPVTALASCGALLIVAEGPFLRFYHAKNSQYISSQRVFKAQAVHGIVVQSGARDHETTLVIWGGRLVRALEINFSIPDHQHDGVIIRPSDVGKAPDWILDLVTRPNSLADESECQKRTCVAVTAHNALLQVSIQRQNEDNTNNSLFRTTISELTSSSRSILYSAHLLWESSNRVLVAAGTAFGEIIYWSWNHDPNVGSASRIHRVFLGHEGSIFGVRISNELPSGCCHPLRRVIASCSDDRTIRIWDVSDVDTTVATLERKEDDVHVPRSRHTGFSNEFFDANSFASSDCLITGWGHTSRIWTVQFLDPPSCSGSLFLLSAGEDATSRTWELSPNDDGNKEFPYKLAHLDCAAHHSGKNLWSTTVSHDLGGFRQVFCAAADSKITTYSISHLWQNTKSKIKNSTIGYTLHDVLSLAQPPIQALDTVASQSSHQSSKKAEFLRNYCFVNERTILLTTNSGRVLLGYLASDTSDQSGTLTHTTLVAQLEDLSGYSVCTSGALPGIAFIAGVKGGIYTYSQTTEALSKIYSVNGKIGEMHTASFTASTGQEIVALLVTIVGQKEARLLYVDSAREAHVFYVVVVPISDGLTGSLVTSMAHVNTTSSHFLCLGFRRGSIAVYRLSEDDPETGQAALFRTIEKAHGTETVTCLKWNALSANSTQGHILSVGRDGRLVVHHIDLKTNFVQLVHNLTLPIGPNIESLYFHEDRLLVHGFSSKKWVLYDVTAEEEVVGVETGGSHRSWAFRPSPSSQGGTLVWTRAADMHIYRQIGRDHTVIRSGGHGREIKAVAVSPINTRNLTSRRIATGAEDTDIKIFQYIDGELICRKTIRKHTTGIQHLQWSEDGDYLFSSGGCEEFYVWRIRELPSPQDVGVVCEHVYLPESEHSDLRIMSFDVMSHSSGYNIAMVFSDSSMKVYSYAPKDAVKWQPLAKATYFTSCLTQCHFLSSQGILTAGTDGHVVVWPLSSGAKTTWQHPARIHQNSSKAMALYNIKKGMVFVASGGDDGSLTFLLARTAQTHPSTSPAASYPSPPVIVHRAHASAITACIIIPRQSQTFILTSGNDEWVRLWEVVVQGMDMEINRKEAADVEDWLVVKRCKKIKTNVADVSSMAMVDSRDDSDIRVLLCGVGMEVIRVDWEVEDHLKAPE
ncbi:Nn.00g036240.m01.CDS01 [Neocucurbitaria sp. VM-36]